MRRQLKSRLNRVVCVSYDPSSLVWVRCALRSRFSRQFMEGQTNMDVSGIGSVSGATPAREVSPSVSQPVTNPAVTARRDEPEISWAGKMLARPSKTPEVGADQLAHTKEAIDNGAYDTTRNGAALSRMFESLGIDVENE